MRRRSVRLTSRLARNPMRAEPTAARPRTTAAATTQTTGRTRSLSPAAPAQSAESVRQMASTIPMLATSDAHWRATLAPTYLMLPGTMPMSRLSIITRLAPHVRLHLLDRVNYLDVEVRLVQLNLLDAHNFRLPA